MSFQRRVDHVAGNSAVPDEANLDPGFPKRRGQFVIRPPGRRVGEKRHVFDAPDDAAIDGCVVQPGLVLEGFGPDRLDEAVPADSASGGIDGECLAA